MDVMRFNLDQYSVNTACVPVWAALALLKKKARHVHKLGWHCVLFISFVLTRRGSRLGVSGKTKDRRTHCLTSTWNKCGFLTNHSPLPNPLLGRWEASSPFHGSHSSSLFGWDFGWKGLLSVIDEPWPIRGLALEAHKDTRDLRHKHWRP